MLALLFLMCAPPMVRAANPELTQVWPLPKWTDATPHEMGMDETKLRLARDYALTGGGAGYITRHGRLVMSWGDPRRRYDLKSSTKGIGVTALGLAIKDGQVRLEDKARRFHPTLGLPPETNALTGWLDEITIAHLATQTAGFEKPGGYTRLLFQPGTKWDYSDSGPNWLAECLTLAYRRDIEALMFERVFTPLGIARDDLAWRNNAYRPHNLDGIPRREFGSGISANVDAMARLGYLYLREGRWQGQEILPRTFVEAVRKTPPKVRGLPVLNTAEYGNASSHYGLLWWNNADKTLEGVPTDAYWTWGLYDSLTIVIPSLDIVVARAGSSWKRDTTEHYDVLKPFFTNLVAAVTNQLTKPRRSDGQVSTPPYPPSPIIKEIVWAPKESIIRKARGSDNWPLTWADDDSLYAAYGDGLGFEPGVSEKLSLGLAKLTGGPENFVGFNLRAASLEQRGDGAAGKKASGLLMVDSVLYLLVRNADNAQLVWSTDRGATWSWSEWKFSTSFGCPTFLNFGKNYAGARDSFVYLYSHDSDSAYTRADRMVLAQAPKDKIRDRAAYEFFRRLDQAGQPVWTKDIQERGSVFVNPKNCYRSGISYNAALKRYLWCQTGRGEDTRFAGGFAIYDAPEPWGPWTTVFFTDEWDIGPGDTGSLPPKWMSADGRIIHLVFSGEDSFSVRKATLIIEGDQTRTPSRP